MAYKKLLFDCEIQTSFLQNEVSIKWVFQLGFESNECLSVRVRVKYILLCNSFVLNCIESIFGMEVL